MRYCSCVSALVTTCVAALLIDVGVIPRGPMVSVFEFGTTGRFHVGTVIISAAAWVVWFLLALWLVLNWRRRPEGA